MTQLFTVHLDGVDITDRVVDCSISEELQRFYNTISFTLEEAEDIILDTEVIIVYGDKTITGFIYSSVKSTRKLFMITARTSGSKLTEPYTPSATKVETALTSHELSALYSAEIGVPISHTAGDLDFGGSYERTGTELEALTTIANITGALYYHKGDTIYIEPNVGITDSGIIVADSEVMDFIPIARSVYNKGIGYIIVRNGGMLSADIISENQIYVEIEECEGSVVIFPNPYGVVELSSGLGSSTPANVIMSEEIDVTEEDVIRLKGAIHSITSVKLNGTIISSYNFEVGHNVLFFTNRQIGTLTIDYVAEAYRSTCNISQTPMGRFFYLDLFYLDQELKYQGFLMTEDECSIVGDTDGSMTVIVPSPMNYVVGYSFWTIGGNPSFRFYNRATEITRTVTAEAGDYIGRENLSLDVHDGGGYISTTSYEISTVTSVTSGGVSGTKQGVSISYNLIDVDGEQRVHFDDYYPAVEIVYTASAQRWGVQFALIEDSVGDIRMVVINNDTYRAFEYDLTETDPCLLNQDYYIDIAGSLGVELFEVVGSAVTYTSPSGGITATSVGSDGRATIGVTTDGEYVIDTKNILPRSTVTLTMQTGL